MNKLLIIVDDDASDVELVRMALRRVDPGLEVRVFKDAEEAKAYFQPVVKPGEPLEFPVPRAVLLDLKMPRYDGFEFLEWACSDSGISGIPIIVLTGSMLRADSDRAMALGAKCCVQKDADTAMLAEGLRKAFAEHAGFVPYWTAPGVSGSGEWGLRK